MCRGRGVDSCRVRRGGVTRSSGLSAVGERMRYVASSRVRLRCPAMHARMVRADDIHPRRGGPAIRLDNGVRGRYRSAHDQQSLSRSRLADRTQLESQLPKPACRPVVTCPISPPMSFSCGQRLTTPLIAGCYDHRSQLQVMSSRRTVSWLIRVDAGSLRSGDGVGNSPSPMVGRYCTCT